MNRNEAYAESDTNIHPRIEFIDTGFMGQIAHLDNHAVPVKDIVLCYR